VPARFNTYTSQGHSRAPWPGRLQWRIFRGIAAADVHRIAHQPPAENIVSSVTFFSVPGVFFFFAGRIVPQFFERRHTFPFPTCGDPKTVVEYPQHFLLFVFARSFQPHQSLFQLLLISFRFRSLSLMTAITSRESLSF